ncbi:MAG: hypothetical protein RMA76_35685 [Deltaproteobacteria bacterium]|jgi:hypothetical protein
MTEAKTSFLGRLSMTLGLFRGLFLPVGLFAVVAIGIHAGSDRVDDLSFVLFNFFDARLDDLLAWLIQNVYGALDVSVSTTAAHTFKAIDFIDLEVKAWAARWTALLVELGADLIFAIPIFRHRTDDVPILDNLRKLYLDFTVLRLVAPLAALLASISGVVIVAQKVQVGTHEAVKSLPYLSLGAGRVAAVVGIVALVLVTWRLATNVVKSAAAWADRRAEADRAASIPMRHRRMRGVWTALVILPITFFAVFASTPIVATLRALWPLS